jgi:hypothetical protein
MDTNLNGRKLKRAPARSRLCRVARIPKCMAIALAVATVMQRLGLFHDAVQGRGVAAPRGLSPFQHPD